MIAAIPLFAAAVAGAMLWLAAPPTGLAQDSEPEWRVGLARVKITPEEPIPMAGYGSRTKPFEGVDADLYAKAMALVDRDGSRSLLITADLIGFPGWFSESVSRRIREATGLERNAILLNGSHTHAGPMVTDRYGRLAPGMQDRVAAYAKRLEDKIVAASLEALGETTPARLAWGTGVANFVMNRREFTPRGVILGVNPRGIADRAVPVLRVQSRGGAILAVVFGAACHNTTLTGRHLDIDADYSGYAQTFVEEAYPGAQAMFIAGCGGDANPYPRGTTEISRNHGRELGAEVKRLVESGLAPVGGPLRTQFERVDLPLQQFSREQLVSMGEDAPSYRRSFVAQTLAMMDRGEKPPTVYNAPFALWRFGEDLTLVGFSGETVVDYAKMTERALGPLNLWVAGYCNDVYGYLPSARVLEEGGYETRGIYAGTGLFTPSTQDVVMATITKMARQAGRRIPND